MSKKYEIKFFCNKCEKDIIGVIHSDFELDADYLDRSREHLESQHKMQEHTYCFACGKKVDPSNSEIQIVGKEMPKGDEASKGVAFTLLMAHFCDDCNKRFLEAKNAR